MAARQALPWLPGIFPISHFSVHSPEMLSVLNAIGLFSMEGDILRGDDDILLVFSQVMRSHDLQPDLTFSHCISNKLFL